MGITFSADEMFEVAERIERNGAYFYRTAAKSVTDPTMHQRLLDLAAWEDGHEKTFAAMRAELTDAERQPTVFDPEDESGLYLAAMADGHVFDVRSDPAAALSGKETLAEILQMAIGREKDSVVFYVGMQNFIPPRLGKQRVEAIVKEEMGHIALLSGELRQLSV
jgi:rubrerythrin